MERKTIPSVSDNEDQDSGLSHIPWHSAFVEAIQLELEPFSNALEFYPEFQLSAEPLRIDCVIIKKAKGIVIRKNIAAIFKETNLLEYKSPDDYVSVEDFYKVYGYACLYASFERVPITDLTITFIESHYPRELLAHLREIRAFVIEEKSPGFYTVNGDIMPIQIIDSRQLSADENLWLKHLNNRLGTAEIRRIVAVLSGYGKAARIKAYLDAITRANMRIFQEAFNMYDVDLSIIKTFEDAGILERLMPKIVDWMGPGLIDRIGPELIAQFEPELIDKMGPELIARMGPELIARMGPELIAQFEPELIDKMGPELIARMGPEFKAKLSAQLEPELKAKIESELLAAGKEEEALTIAKNMINLGLPFETIVSATNLDPEKINALYPNIP